LIGSLRGRVLDRQGGTDKSPAGEVLLEVAGVGYRVTVTPATLARVVVDDDLFLHVHHHFWENDQRLYGFPARAEREAFEGLLGAHKVGPALALAIIGTYPPAELAVILETDDVAALCHVPGVGTKTAQRLLVDLKSSLVRLFADASAAAPIDLTDGDQRAVRADVREALASLGYGPDEVKQAVAALPSDTDHDPGTLLKLALRALAGD
jgi:holliday junction DNA helicase RuvA